MIIYNITWQNDSKHVVGKDPSSISYTIFDNLMVSKVEDDDKSFEEKLANNTDTDTNILSIYYRMTKDGFNSKFDPTKTISVLDTLNFRW